MEWAGIVACVVWVLNYCAEHVAHDYQWFCMTSNSTEFKLLTYGFPNFLLFSSSFFNIKYFCCLKLVLVVICFQSNSICHDIIRDLSLWIYTYTISYRIMELRSVFPPGLVTNADVLIQSSSWESLEAKNGPHMANHLQNVLQMDHPR